MKLIHGGDIYSDGFSPDTILDFSANINPLGIPKGVKEVLMDNVDQCVHYPDPLCRELRGAISTAEGINPDWFVFGNGAADLIFRLVLA
ncbi:MAG: threonine-phosphate decarboxylase, partial [Anaerovoracaceae bacterium]